MKRKALIALFSLALSGLMPAPVTAGVTVRVAAEATVHGNEIALGDVATVQGDEALARRLRKLVIGPGSAARSEPAARSRLSAAPSGRGAARAVEGATSSFPTRCSSPAPSRS